MFLSLITTPKKEAHEVMLCVELFISYCIPCPGVPPGSHRKKRPSALKNEKTFLGLWPGFSCSLGASFGNAIYVSA